MSTGKKKRKGGRHANVDRKRETMQIIRAEDKPLTPWKNGGGLTREIAAHFDKTRHAEFLWRISMAIIDKSCVFSRFDGIDRSIAVLEGKGIILKKSTNPVAIGLTDQPISFTGEEEVTAIPYREEATTDLNIMTRRGFFSHQMRYYSFYGRRILQITAETTFIICKSRIMINEQKLNRFDAVTGFTKGEEISLRASKKGQIFIIELFAC